MQREHTIKHSMTGWGAAILGLCFGVGALGSLMVSLLSPHWVLVREPIVLSESGPFDYHYSGLLDDYNYGVPVESLQPLVTTVTFRLGLWTACPHINTTGIHISKYFLSFLLLFNRTKYINIITYVFR